MLQTQQEQTEKFLSVHPEENIWGRSEEEDEDQSIKFGAANKQSVENKWNSVAIDRSSQRNL